ncbi:MAG: hypothetical protein N2114_07110 [Candidatus Goldbacteria bacterium]|nr:hypothetical protein [Candidatus Goldiibacteriota bacterium]
MKNRLFLFFYIFLIINIFAENKALKDECIYEIKYADGKKIYNLKDARIICAPQTLINIKGYDIRIKKGSRIWVTVSKKKNLKIINNKNIIEISGATVDLDIFGNSMAVFNGIIYFAGKRVLSGHAINLKTKDISVIKEIDEWQRENIKMEASSVLIEIQAEKELKENYNKKFMEIIKNNYWLTNEVEPEFLIKITISESDGKINGTVTHIPAQQIIGIIDETLDKNDITNINVTVIASRILDVINLYRDNELHNGRMVIIEASDFINKDIDEFRKILSDIPGNKILEEKSYYNIKNVFKMNFLGNGHDIAEIIKNRNKKVNIYYISKNNLKIKIQN